MCKPNFELLFCPCSQDKATVFETENINTVLCWTLSKYLGKNESSLDGLVMLPPNKLANEVTSNYIIKNLNTTHLFDFKYKPQEGNNLRITEHSIKPWKKAKFKYQQLYGELSFIFTNGKWIQEFYHPLEDKVEDIKNGIVIESTNNK